MCLSRDQTKTHSRPATDRKDVALAKRNKVPLLCTHMPETGHAHQTLQERGSFAKGAIVGGKGAYDSSSKLASLLATNDNNKMHLLFSAPAEQR